MTIYYCITQRKALFTHTKRLMVFWRLLLLLNSEIMQTKLTILMVSKHTGFFLCLVTFPKVFWKTCSLHRITLTCNQTWYPQTLQLPVLIGNVSNLPHLPPGLLKSEGDLQTGWMLRKIAGGKGGGGSTQWSTKPT